MIVALLNQKGGVGKTTLATHIAGELAMRGQHVVLLDADPQGSSLDWTQRRSQQGLPRLFSAVGLARETLHQEAPELARRADHVVIDGPPRIAALALRAAGGRARADPGAAQPYDVWASAEMVSLIREASGVPAATRGGLRHQPARQHHHHRPRGAAVAGRTAAARAALGGASAHRLRRQRGRWPARTRDSARQRRRPRNHRPGGRTAEVADMTAKPPPRSKRVGIGARPPANPHAEAWIRQAMPMRWAKATFTPRA